MDCVAGEERDVAELRDDVRLERLVDRHRGGLALFAHAVDEAAHVRLVARLERVREAAVALLRGGVGVAGGPFLYDLLALAVVEGGLAHRAEEGEAVVAIDEAAGPLAHERHAAGVRAAFPREVLATLELRGEHVRVLELEVLALVEQLAASGVHARRVACAERPAGDVDEVQAVVRQVARAVSAEEAPVVVDELGLEGAPRCGTLPEVPVESVRDCDALGGADGRAVGEAPGLCPVRLADLPGAKGGDGLLRGEGAAALRAELEHCAGLPLDGGENLRLAGGHADGLLEVEGLAGLHGPDAGEDMPVVGRRHDDAVDVRVAERVADVVELLRLVAAYALHLACGVCARGGVHVAHSRDLGVLHLAHAAHHLVAASARALRVHAEARAVEGGARAAHHAEAYAARRRSRAKDPAGGRDEERAAAHLYEVSPVHVPIVPYPAPPPARNMV